MQRKIYIDFVWNIPPNYSGTQSYLNIRVCFTICIYSTECLSENDFQNRFSPIDRSKRTWNPIFFLPSKIRWILPKRYYERNKYYLLFWAHFFPVKHRNKCIHIIWYTVFTCSMHHAYYYTRWFEFYVKNISKIAKNWFLLITFYWFKNILQDKNLSLLEICSF